MISWGRLLVIWLASDADCQSPEALQIPRWLGLPSLSCRTTPWAAQRGTVSPWKRSKSARVGVTALKRCSRSATVNRRNMPKPPVGAVAAELNLVGLLNGGREGGHVRLVDAG